METLQVIGEGNTAQVVALSHQKVAKLFFAHVTEAAIEHEYVIHQAISNLGLPIPFVYKREMIHGKRAVIYERISGPTLIRQIENKPWRAFPLIMQLAKLHANVHDTKKLSNLPSLQDVIKKKISSVDTINEEEKTMIDLHLKKLSDGNSLCHGDFHPDNVLLSERGPIIIDWTDATMGNRLADVARTLLILKYGGLPDHTSKIRFRTTLYIRKLLASHYVRSYKKGYDFPVKELENWTLPIAAARLSENLPLREKKQLVSFIRQYLKDGKTL